MAEPNHTVALNRRLAAAASCAIGDVLVADDDGHYVVATSAERADGRRAEAIALSAFSGTGVGRADVQQTGTLTPSISGLEPGAASWVRCSATGQPERCTPSGSDDIIGRCEADGRLHLMFGVLTADIVNGGGGGGAALPDYWTDQGDGRLHTLVANTDENNEYTVADLGATGTITRGYGSFIADGFVAGMLASADGFTNAANNFANVEITAVTATVLTLNTGSLVAEGPTTSGRVNLYAGGHHTVGKVGSTFAKYGAVRLPLSGNFEGDFVWMAFPTNSGLTIPGIAVSDGDALCFGGTRTDANIEIDSFGDGIAQARQVDSMRFWAQQHRIHSKNIVWGSDAGGGGGFDRSRDGILTTTNTPTAFARDNAMVYADSTSPAGTSTWIRVGGQIIYRASTGIGSTWAWDGTNVTGTSGTQVRWVRTDLDVGFIPGFCAIDGVRSVLHPSGNRTVIPDFNGTLPTSSSGGSPGGASGTVQINNAGSFGGIAGGTTGNILQATSATAWASVAPSFNASVISAGTLPTTRGGTNVSAAGTSGNLLQSDGTNWSSVAPSFNASVITAGTLVVGRGGTGLTALGTNVSTLLGTNLAAGFTTFAATPSSANLSTLVTDETGSGALVFGTSPTLATPAISSPTITGTPKYQCTRGEIRSVVTELQTAATTQVNCGTVTLTDQQTYTIDVIVECQRRTSNTKRGRWKFSAVVSRNGAGAVLDQLVVGDAFSLNAATVTCDVNGNDFRVRVTPADTDGRNLRSEMSIRELTAA
jgi:hypothetical protein